MMIKIILVLVIVTLNGLGQIQDSYIIYFTKKQCDYR